MSQLSSFRVELKLIAYFPVFSVAQDYDTPSHYLTFVLLSVAGGRVVYRDDSYNTPLSNFTQFDINEEQICFLHDSNQLSGRIDFYVTDGDHTSPEQTLYIRTNPVALEQIKNDILHVFPLTRKQISSEQLKYKCSDDNRDVIYEITILPQFGRVVYESLEDGQLRELKEFTQHDLNNGRIIYEHTHPTVELRSNDSFYFDVRSKMANSLMDQVFNIEISVSSGGLVRFLPFYRLELDEGDTAPIKLDLSKVLEYLETRAGTQAPELYIETYPPAHGEIELHDGKVNLSHIVLDDFVEKKVYYHHDHSDTVEDKILLSVYLLQGNIFLCNLTIPIIIKPVNDHPFALLTQSPQLTIIEGENRTITKRELYTEDADTGPSQIVYDIISGPDPRLGALMKVSDEGIAYDVLTDGNQFTQLDINENRIVYVHTGIPQSTTFLFNVSDGQFNPSREIFTLNVVPVSLAPGNEKESVHIQQGSQSAIIRPNHFAIDTNADKTRLAFNVTDGPRHGAISWNNRQVYQFTYNQLHDGEIGYLQTDMNKSSDNFKVTIYVPGVSHAVLENAVVDIVVEPVIKINGISIASDDKIRLSTSIQDDNPQQLKLNRYNPKIVITRKPDHGKIKKIYRNSGDTEHLNDKEVTTFTYKELKSGVIYFIARKLPDNAESINDCFEYTLFIKSHQPGQGFVSIEIHKVKSHLLGGSGDDKNDVNITYEASWPINYLFIVSTLIGMVALVLILIMFLRCHSNAKTKKNELDKDFMPPLPRPPDFLNNNRLYSSSDGDNSIPVTASSTPLPILSSIPHCKVTPIGNLDDSESDEMMDLNHPQMPCYPYGDENDEWSSSCDVGNEVNYSSIMQAQQQTPRTNPLLRRNQYWV